MPSKSTAEIVAELRERVKWEYKLGVMTAAADRLEQTPKAIIEAIETEIQAPANADSPNLRLGLQVALTIVRRITE